MIDAPDAALLLEAWEELARVAPGERLYRTRRLQRPGRLELRTGLRETDGAPCLVVSPGAAGEMIASFETAGLRLSRAADPAGTLLVLSLEEPDRRDLFAEICSDCVRAVIRGDEEGETDLVSVLAARLQAWRAFLRDQAGALSPLEIIGLIGELIILERLLAVDPDAVSAWKAPDNGLHDFERGGHAIEVKTALGPARHLHVSTLDQLDEAGLASLHVAHVRLLQSPDGETLPELAGRIEHRLAGERARGGYRNALLRRGLAPGLGAYVGPKVICAGIECYLVCDAFPRLRRSDVALGISDATYEVEVRALAGLAADTDVVLNALGGAGNE